MNSLSELLNFFGNPDLDRHRLLQGQWAAYRLDWDDPEAWSDKPIDLLLSMLSEDLPQGDLEGKPAVRALHALIETAMTNLDSASFDNMRRPFWSGFQFVARHAASELQLEFRELTRADLQQLIANRYALQTTSQ